MSWYRCKGRLMSSLLSNCREGSRSWFRGKGRWMKAVATTIQCSWGGGTDILSSVLAFTVFQPSQLSSVHSVPAITVFQY